MKWSQKQGPAAMAKKGRGVIKHRESMPASPYNHTEGGKATLADHWPCKE